MLIRESKLRQIIKSVIRESMSGNRRRLKENDTDEYLPNGAHVMGSVPEYDLADPRANAEGMRLWYETNTMPPQLSSEMHGNLNGQKGIFEYTREGWQFMPSDYEENDYGSSNDEIEAWHAEDSSYEKLMQQYPGRHFNSNSFR